MRMSHLHAGAIGAHLVMLFFCLANGFAFPFFLNVSFGGLQVAFYRWAIEREAAK